MSGGGAGVTGSGVPKGKTLAGAASAGSGEMSVLGCMVPTANISSPSSTMIRNENIIVRICNVPQLKPSYCLKSDDLDVEDDSEFGRGLTELFTYPLTWSPPTAGAVEKQPNYEFPPEDS